MSNPAEPVADEATSLKAFNPKKPEGSTARLIKDATVRQLLALLFFVLFAATVVMSYLHLSTSEWKNTQQWLQIMLPAETALLGSATGFYFGTKKSDD